MRVATEEWIRIMGNAFLVIVLIVAIPTLITIVIPVWVISLGHIDLWVHFRKYLIRFHDILA